MLYSKFKNGFFDPAISSIVPPDAVEISDAKYKQLLEGQSKGMIIAGDEFGNPILVNPPAPTPDQIAIAVQNARSVAYTKESDPLFFKSQRGEATHEQWVAKVNEIKARYPDGVMPK